MDEDIETVMPVDNPSGKITPTVKTTVIEDTYPDVPAGQYGIVAIDPSGLERPASWFTISETGFNKHYKALTVAPEGTAELGKAQFQVKKNPNR